jgi:hypothetical protein
MKEFYLQGCSNMHFVEETTSVSEERVASIIRIKE